MVGLKANDDPAIEVGALCAPDAGPELELSLQADVNTIAAQAAIIETAFLFMICFLDF